jgi:tRNA nucleotidyltransferase (CCA-adding enzyme)
MSRVDEVLHGVTRLVVPSSAEKRRLESLADGILARTGEEAKSHVEVSGAILGGSFAKGTWLPGDVDIDVFVRISPNVDEKTFERIGLNIGREVTSGYPRGKKYAQHPYTEATIDGVKVNIVPCYDVEPPNWKSAADRSPYHLRLVEKLREEQKLQIRLLKKFMKGVDVYGAEIESQGFSGYVAEVLVMKYGDLKGVLRYFADFKPYSSEEFFHLPDLVDENRDLAIAVSMERLGRMILASRAFLRRPSTRYFLGPHRKERPLLRREVVCILFSHEKLSEDTLWGELKRTQRHLKARVEDRGFKIARFTAVSNQLDSSAYLMIPEFDTLPKIEQRVGPSVHLRNETEEFISKNSSRAKLVWVGEDARVTLLQERKNTSLSEFLKETISRDTGQFGASKEMATGLARSGKVVSGGELAGLLASRPWLQDGMKDIVSDTIGTSVS